ncbi:hypothetical protein [Cupriavidus pinatubonensis]|uniref:hypothetical protein n=1 Tax=Cupriavidus pinatubonensis TaxID=248026 RepID=UPI001CC4D2EE|nr:hypothetical protein [Cupriavidus pinatubonensis]
MSSATDSAEQRFRAAFERLKADNPSVLPRGTPVSQNNVAKEAGTDPTALRKARYPTLIREIQTWVKLAGQEQAKRKQRQQRQKQNRESLTQQIKRLTIQRDKAQSQLVGAHRQMLELLQEKARLQSRLDELLPPPTPLRA